MISNVWVASAQTFEIPIKNPSFEQPGNEFVLEWNRSIFHELNPESPIDPNFASNPENWFGFATHWEICGYNDALYRGSGSPDISKGPYRQPQYFLDFLDSVRISHGLPVQPFNNLILLDVNDSNLKASYGNYFLRIASGSFVVEEFIDSVQRAVYSENVIQQFPCGFKKDAIYTFKAFCRSGRELNGDQIISNARKLKVILTNDICGDKVEGAYGPDAFVSEAISQDEWVETIISFIPTQDYAYFVLWADSVQYPIKDDYTEFVGSLFIDSIAPISYTYPHVVKGKQPATALQKGDCYTLEVEINSLYATNFEWYTMNGDTLGQFPIICPDSTTTYVVKAYNQCGFKGYDTVTVKIYNPIEKIFNNLYPNPIQNGTTITLESAEEQQFNVYDTAGRIIQQYTIGKGIQQLPISIAAGIYYCVFSSEATKTYRLIVIK